MTFRVIQYCGKVLYKADHARLLIQCAHMYTTPPFSSNNDATNNDINNNNKTKVNECVQRALAIASQIT